MAGSEKKKIAILLALAIIPSGAALDFEIGIDSEAEASVFNPQYDNNTEKVHEFNVSVENSASVGCNYHLIGKFRYDNRTEVIRSQAYGLWAGDSRTAELNFMPQNYTGVIDADINIGFCSHEKNITDYRFNVTERTTFDAEVESETLESDERKARINVKAEEGRMIPIDQPGYWQVGPAEIRNNTAEVEYYAPLYQPREITYAVLDREGEVLGKTVVDTTSPEMTWRDWIRKNPWSFLSFILAISLIGNIYLLRERIVPEYLKELISDIEFGDRDIRR